MEKRFVHAQKGCCGIRRRYRAMDGAQADSRSVGRRSPSQRVVIDSEPRGSESGAPSSARMRREARLAGLTLGDRPVTPFGPLVV